MVGREEADVFADDGAGAVEGGEHAVVRDRGESLHVGVARVEEDVAGLVVLDAHAEALGLPLRLKLPIGGYDGRGQLWRVSEAHCINYYDVQAFWSTLEVHHDLQNGRYLAVGLDNENRMYDFGIKRTPADFNPEALRRDGVR